MAKARWEEAVIIQGACKACKLHAADSYSTTYVEDNCLKTSYRNCDALVYKVPFIH